MKKIGLMLFLLLAAGWISAQVAKTQVVMCSAVANGNGSITITWPQETYAGQFRIYRRNSMKVEDFGTAPIGTVAGNQNSYTDVNVPEGSSYEYLVVKINGTTTDALGYIYVGNKKTEEAWFGGVILLVDSNYINPLAAEIARLTDDLKAEGWLVKVIYGSRTEKPQNVKARIKNAYNTMAVKPRSLFVLGHVRVPYSGFFSSGGDAPPPDGHVEGSGNHTGAWPADVYYAELSNDWTDEFVTCITGGDTRNKNNPFDDKFDNTKIPDTVDLEMGRVDLFNMNTFSKNDTLLIKKYLDRNHLWRTGQWNVVERALIDNNFTSLNLASTGYHNFPTMIRQDSIFDNRDYFTAQKAGSYLWSYGCGAGSYTTCSGVGSSANFNDSKFENVFTILAGSYFGDWDNANAFLKAPLAQSSLASFWGGIPKWYVHHMALGMPIGYGVKLTQNNKGSNYFTGAFNYSQNSVHIALMGDPTLRMRNVPPPSNLTASSAGRQVSLRWNKAPGVVDGYCVYRVDTLTNRMWRVNRNIITDTVYTDAENWTSGRFRYAVRAIRLETTASGTWYNLSGASFKEVDHVNGISPNEFQASVSVYPNPASDVIRIESELISSGDLELTDMSGRSVLSSRMEYGAADLKISDVPAGIYLLRISSGGNSVVKKVSKI